MLKKLSDNIAIYIDRNLNSDNSKAEIYSYGLQLFLGALFEVLAVIIASCFLNVLYTTLVVLISFTLFRRIIGGTHCKTYGNCFFATTITMLAMGYTGKNINLHSNSLSVITIVIYISAIIHTLIFIPMGTEKKSVKNPKTRLKIKLKTIVLLCIWAGFVFRAKDSQLSEYIFSSLLGVAGAFFFSTPFSYILINKLDSYLSIKKGGVI